VDEIDNLAKDKYLDEAEEFIEVECDEIALDR